MAKRKTAPKKSKDQHAKFVEAARQLGADMSEADFRRVLGKIAPNPKKPRP